MDFFALIAARAVARVLNALPIPVRMKLIRGALAAACIVMPKYRRIAERNLALAYPELSPAERDGMFSRFLTQFSRLVMDFFRLPTIPVEWFRTNVDYPDKALYEQMRAEYPDRGLVIATGHLGSFELSCQAAVLTGGYRLDVVARDLKLPSINRWVNEHRELHGARVVSREGGFKEVLRSVRSGRDVALLFDQNVTRNHAAFVPFFGRPAATTKAVALAAIRGRTGILVFGFNYRGGDRYEIETIRCSVDDLFDGPPGSLEERVEVGTARVTALFEQLIRRQPDAWFWIHRRWKTSPPGVEENFYG